MQSPLALLTLFGGVALLVFGVRYLRKGLDRLFGQRLGTLMQRLAARRGWAFASGLGVSLIAPSSTTMSLLAVHAVRAGHLTARQMLTIVLGANIGLTVLVLLIALDLQLVAPILILVGVPLFQFTRGNRSRGIGQVILALGFILMAIGIMKGAAADAHEVWQSAITQAEAGGESPTSAWGIINFDTLRQHAIPLSIFACLVAILIQSSTATIALVIGLGAADAFTFRAAIPAVIGANVGLSVTTLIVGWRLLEPRRLALGNLFLKLVVAAFVLLLLVFLGDMLPEPTGPSFGLAVAGVHTGFNVMVAIVGLPSVGIVTRLMERLVPPPAPGTRKSFGPRYISGGPIGGVALALGQSLREITHVSEIIRGMLRDIWTALKTSDEKLAREVAERDDRVDLLDTEIKRFLTRLAKEESGDYDADEQMCQLCYLTELETLGDIIDKNLTELVLKKIRIGAEFSKEGAEELEDFYEKVVENVVIAETARLNAGLAESHETSAIHLDVLTHLKRVNSCVSHVAFAILEDRRTNEAPLAADSE
jgi:phosphate:Na+ symporter